MDFDAVLLLSFGGPEGREQVMPFLENVTRGRGIPAGTSRRRRRALPALRRRIADQRHQPRADRGSCGRLAAAVPVYFGNRNWEPYVEDTVAAMRDNGIRRAAVFTTSAWGGYSGCTQYVEDIARARRPPADTAPELVKLRHYFDHPLFVEMFSRRDHRGSCRRLSDDARAGVHRAFHSDCRRSRRGPDLYSRQVAYASQARRRCGRL